MKRLVTEEAFFTSPEYASKCLQLLRTYVNINEFDAVVEPSAGTGVFVELIEHDSIHAIDTMPRSPRVEKADFFAWNPPDVKKILTIGNPPFGQRAALAVRFLNRAADFSEVVAFILPRSFNKYTFQMRVHPHFHLLDSLEGDSFIGVDGEDLTVKTVFQIWQRREEKREDLLLPLTHKDFLMIHAHLSRTSEEKRKQLVEEYPFAIAQVGSNFFPRESGLINKGSWWFIKPLVAGVCDRFCELDFSFINGMNTAHSSLSKRDIVFAYQQVLDDSQNQLIE